MYSYVTVGEGTAFVIGWNLVLEYAIGTASVARACTAYLDTFIDKKLQAFYLAHLPIGLPYLSDYFDALAFALAVVLSSCLAVGVKKSTVLNNVFTALNVTVVVMVTVGGFCHADLMNWSLPAPQPQPQPPTATTTVSNLTNTTTGFGGSGGFFPYGLHGTLRGAATCFYAFIGFDSVAAGGEEAVEPTRTIPGAILLSLLIVCVMYVGVSASLTLMVPYFLQDVQAPLAEAFRTTGDNWLAVVVSVGAVLGLSTNLIGTLFPLPRILYSMASDGLLFRSLASVHPKLRTPVLATMVGGFSVGLLAGVLDLQSLVDMMSIGTLMAYTIVAVCILILRYENVDGVSHGVRSSGNSGRTATTPLLLPPPPPPPSIPAPPRCSASYGAIPQPQPEPPERPLTPSPSTTALVHTRSMRLFLRQLLGQSTGLRRSSGSYSVRICRILIACISALCVASAVSLSRNTADSPWMTALSVTTVAFLLTCTVLLSLQPKCDDRDDDCMVRGDGVESGLRGVQGDHQRGFRVPMVPVLPVCSMLLNMYLTAKLSSETWVRFGVWMTLGILVYATYGWHNSSEEYRARGLVPPNEAAVDRSSSGVDGDDTSSNADDLAPVINN